MKIKINPIGKDGTRLFENDIFDFDPGVTILVGCNGAGKTTLMTYIEDKYLYNNDDGVSAKYFSCNDTGREIDRLLYIGGKKAVDLGCTMLSSSEGEKITMNLIHIFDWMWNECKKNSVNNIILLLDSIDSGLDISNIRMIKDVFKDVIKKAKNKYDTILYILVSANDYALVENQKCLDVRIGKYIVFDSWDEYVDFCIKSHNHKENRYSKGCKK